jgi:hypothetical protein
MNRLLGADRSFLDIDERARAAYDARIRGERPVEAAAETKEYSRASS